jgi:hypothetical protein
VTNTSTLDSPGKDSSGDGQVKLWAGDRQCGWRLYRTPTDRVHYRHCGAAAGHTGGHRPAAGGPQVPGEVWWRFADISGTTIPDIEREQDTTLLYVTPWLDGRWLLELHRAHDNVDVFVALAKRQRGGSALVLREANASALQALADVRARAEAFDRQLSGVEVSR